MIYVRLNTSGFEYDIYNLVRSFLPGAKLGFLYPRDLAHSLEGGKTAAEALKSYRLQRADAEEKLAYWKEKVAERQGAQ